MVSMQITIVSTNICYIVNICICYQYLHSLPTLASLQRFASVSNCGYSITYITPNASIRKCFQYLRLWSRFACVTNIFLRYQYSYDYKHSHFLIVYAITKILALLTDIGRCYQNLYFSPVFVFTCKIIEIETSQHRPLSKLRTKDSLLKTI